MLVVEIELTPEVSPNTSVGVERSVVELSPSCPYQFDPQHLTLPFVSRAHVW